MMVTRGDVRAGGEANLSTGLLYLPKIYVHRIRSRGPPRGGLLWEKTRTEVENVLVGVSCRG